VADIPRSIFEYTPTLAVGAPNVGSNIDAPTGLLGGEGLAQRRRVAIERIGMHQANGPGHVLRRLVPEYLPTLDVGVPPLIASVIADIAGLSPRGRKHRPTPREGPAIL
jgi:hypothetical protein